MFKTFASTSALLAFSCCPSIPSNPCRSVCSDQDSQETDEDQDTRNTVSLLHVLTPLLTAWAAVVLSLWRLALLVNVWFAFETADGFQLTLDQRLHFFVVIELHIVFVSFETLFVLVPLFTGVVNAVALAMPVVLGQVSIATM